MKGGSTPIVPVMLDVTATDWSLKVVWNVKMVVHRLWPR